METHSPGGRDKSAIYYLKKCSLNNAFHINPNSKNEPDKRVQNVCLHAERAVNKRFASTSKASQKGCKRNGNKDQFLL